MDGEVSKERGGWDEDEDDGSTEGSGGGLGWGV